MLREWRRRAPPGCRLSERQLQVASLLALDFTQVEIAGLLGIKPTTVRTHMVHARQILGVHTSAALAAQVAVRWMSTPRSGTQHYLDEFEQRLGVVRARRRLRTKADQRRPFYPDLDDQIKLLLNEGEE